jgi:hypothetical protein
LLFKDSKPMASVYIVYHSGYGHTKLQQITGPSPEALNRVGPFTGPMSASFQVTPPHAPVPGDIRTAEAYGKRIVEITQRWVKAKSM